MEGTAFMKWRYSKQIEWKIEGFARDPDSPPSPVPMHLRLKRYSSKEGQRRSPENLGPNQKAFEAENSKATVHTTLQNSLADHPESMDVDEASDHSDLETEPLSQSEKLQILQCSNSGSNCAQSESNLYGQSHPNHGIPKPGTQFCFQLEKVIRSDFPVKRKPGRPSQADLISGKYAITCHCPFCFKPYTNIDKSRSLNIHYPRCVVLKRIEDWCVFCGKSVGKNIAREMKIKKKHAASCPGVLKFVEGRGKLKGWHIVKPGQLEVWLAEHGYHRREQPETNSPTQI
jgi:hypothetical protein